MAARIQSCNQVYHLPCFYILKTSWTLLVLVGHTTAVF